MARDPSGENVLVSAPTGSGKTLAAFLICLDGLVRAGLDGSLPDTTQVLYVSPLKALSNDIQKNLDVPLAGIATLAAERGLLLPAIRTAVRTGDTPASERQRMVQAPAAHPGHHAGVALHSADRGAQPAGAAQRRRRSSWTRFTRWWTTSAARIWRCRWRGSTISS